MSQQIIPVLTVRTSSRTAGWRLMLFMLTSTHTVSNLGQMLHGWRLLQFHSIRGIKELTREGKHPLLTTPYDPSVYASTALRH